MWNYRGDRTAVSPIGDNASGAPAGAVEGGVMLQRWKGTPVLHGNSYEEDPYRAAGNQLAADRRAKELSRYEQDSKTNQMRLRP